MTRRALFFFAAAEPDKPAPVSEQSMNRFAGYWNEYVERLKIGVIDLKQWRAVCLERERLWIDCRRTPDHVPPRAVLSSSLNR